VKIAVAGGVGDGAGVAVGAAGVSDGAGVAMAGGLVGSGLEVGAVGVGAATQPTSDKNNSKVSKDVRRIGPLYPVPASAQNRASLKSGNPLTLW
jgi:hypothetical protein